MHFDLFELGEAALRLGVALLLGSAIGFERQWNQKMAGLRTNALVALGAAGFVTFSGLVGAGDPTRVAAQVVTGIGFLGAGVILREGVNVHGLNTAATLWCSAMVGTMAGAGHGGPALLAAVMVIATNLVLRPLIRRREQPPRDQQQCRDPLHRRGRLPRCRGGADAFALAQRAGAGGARPAPARQRGHCRYVQGDGDGAGRRRQAQRRGLEQIVGRLSLDPTVTGVTWQIDRTIPES